MKFSTTHHFASHSNVHSLIPSEQNSECHRTNYTWDWTLMVSDVHHQELETTSQFTCQVIKYLYLESKKLNQLKKKYFAWHRNSHRIQVVPVFMLLYLASFRHIDSFECESLFRACKIIFLLIHIFLLWIYFRAYHHADRRSWK